MSGTEIRPSPSYAWAGFSLFLLVCSLASGIGAGPFFVYALSTAGIIAAGVGILKNRQRFGTSLGSGLPSGLIFFHVLFLMAAAWLQAMFITPLPQPLLKMPSLTRGYEEVEGAFRLKGPMGWKYTPVHSEQAVGVKLQPDSQKNYIGVSEITVLVRVLETPPKTPALFLQKAVEMFNQKRSEEADLFEFTSDTATLIDGTTGVWSDLSIKRFWLPLRQVSLFGIKNRRYLCSVSATGLKKHSTLYRVICLGLYETLEIGPHPL